MKRLYTKELPSDIWHPLLLFSLNQEKGTEEGEKSHLYVSQKEIKRHDVPMCVVYMRYANIFKYLENICWAAYKNLVLQFVFAEE